MDIMRALKRYWALLAHSDGLEGKTNAVRAMAYYTMLRFKLWSNSKRIGLRVDQHRFDIDLGRKELASVLEVLLERCYEPSAGWVTGPGDVVFDIGSNIGVFSVMQGARVGHGRVYAFEPSPTTYTRLARNIALNGLRNVESFQQALGDQAGRVRFVDKPISLNSYVLRSETSEPTVEVEAGTLDGFVAARRIDRINLMKIDTEGHELQVLSGGPVALAMTDRIVLEIHAPGDEAPVRSLLESAGFSASHQQRDLLFFERSRRSSGMVPAEPGAESRIRHGDA